MAHLVYSIGVRVRLLRFGVLVFEFFGLSGNQSQGKV